MNAPSFGVVIGAMNRLGYKVYDDLAKPFNVNIVGVRTENNTPRIFDDWITLFYPSAGVWNYHAFRATTDPGIYWLMNPMNALGTAIVKEGQYKGLWQIGLYRGYRALTQKAPVTVIRDFNRDMHLDYHSGREETGVFGIHLHRASAFQQSVSVDKWSAGCQVISDPMEFAFLMDVCRKGADIFGNSFTYTLIHEREL